MDSNINNSHKNGNDAVGIEDDGFLSETLIVSTTRRLIETVGMESFTMRRVAEELGVTPMALYHHVGDKQMLLALVAESVIALVPDPVADTEPWHERLRQGFLAVHDETTRYPGLELYIWRVNGFHPSGARKLDRTLQMLKDAGFEEQDARRAIYVLLAYGAGYFIIQHVKDRPGPLSGMPHGKKGPVSAHEVSQDANSVMEISFKIGLDLIIDGIRAQLAVNSFR